MFRKLKEGVDWVGKVDWELRMFHGDEYSTHRGTSYNSYLIRDEKTVLIDTVWAPFGKEFVKNLKSIVDLRKIDSIVANHAEIDHSGGLEELMKYVPSIPIYCTANGVKSLKGHFHQDWNFVPVKTGDKLSLGKKELVFIEAPMLHWPDSMFCYLTEDNILFSSDAFGQHYATDRLYNHLVDQAEMSQEAIKYYANILTPFSNQVEKKINQFLELDLPVEMICPGHGVIWRESPLQIVDRYLQWSRDYKENQITLIYDTMWNGTKMMAEAISEGIKSEDDEVVCKLYNISRSDKNDVVTEVFKSKVILVGSPTINRGILSAVAGFLEGIRGLKFRGKKAAAFGTYGWSGESVKMISQKLEEGGFGLVNEGIQSQWMPDEGSIKDCVEYGKDIAHNTRGI
jgi:flavorubredoxin